MCGRFSLSDPDQLERAYGARYNFASFSEIRMPRYNVAPTQRVLGVTNDGRDVVEIFSWGIRNRINVRSESIDWKHRNRCVIFADGFYEWRGGKPMYFQLRDYAPFAFAGVWSETASLPECAIITCAPNELVQIVHDRMPVMLSRDSMDAWLGDVGEDAARSLLRPYPAEAMTARPVSSRLNNARYDAADVLADNDPIQQQLF